MAEKASKSIHNWRRNPSPKCYRKWRKLAVRNLAVCCGGIWLRREKMAIWIHNYSPSGAQKPQRYL